MVISIKCRPNQSTFSTVALIGVVIAQQLILLRATTTWCDFNQSR